MAGAAAVGALLTTAACSDGDDSASSDESVAASPVAERAASTSPAPSASWTLTPSGARIALITEGDLEDDWNQVNNASTWHDSLLIGKVDAAEFVSAKSQAAACQRLLDSLYDDDLLGKPSGASALTGFQEGDSRLLYQVAAYKKSGLDDSFKWLGSLTDECDEFTAVASDGSKRTVQVVEASIPKSGDERQGLTVTVNGSSDGSPVTLTLDVAAVRVGTDAITITNGGVDGADHDSTKTAVQLGTRRLQDVQAGKTPAPEPSGGQQD
ncbi:hypothetical protein [Streptomyces sp. NPDC002588]|uniref:hypothetical protein n=1 Tax=Streptomyces sp. NPDC002588 TaxID=3154419 RepID=UPI00331B8700